MKKLSILLIAVICFPLLLLFIYSFSYHFPFPNILPESFTLRGFNGIFKLDSLIIISDSIKVAVLSTLFTLSICIPASKALSDKDLKIKGKNVFLVLFTSPLILPLASITMGIHLLFIKLNLTNTLLGVVLINSIPCIPYGVRLITNIMNIVGTDYEKVARNLGASPISAFFKATFPSLVPGITSASFLIFIISFSGYLPTLLIGGGKIITLPVVMIPYIQNGDRTLSSIYSLVFILSSFLVLLILEKLLNVYYKKRGFVIQFNI